MPTNVEIKASISDVESFLTKAKQLSGSEAIKIDQEDTFFHIPNGRLKLRVENKGHTGKLIHYTRNDISGPKQSNFTETLVQNPDELKDILRLALGVKGTVRKVRQLFMIGQTRVHVDAVEGLGNFMELEVCMEKGQSISEGEKIAQNLMKQLNIQDNDLIVCAYMDLLINKKE